MTNDSHQSQSPPAEAAAGAPETLSRQQFTTRATQNDAHTALEQEKYGRARNHVAGLGHIIAKDVFKDYRRSWLTPFFGSNEPELSFKAVEVGHPCQIFSREVHKCLDANRNSFAFCQTRVSAFQQCLREFSV
ncbi:hypothetical protein NESM_000264700 [Novymonas esmeraldas]|uniref:CHCH domain-containing protein n=1 Tax=Novymonas esmeraldas TaxID=1808958 RepID=A0AAW0F8Y2_9TRYP